MNEYIWGHLSGVKLNENEFYMISFFCFFLVFFTLTYLVELEVLLVFSIAESVLFDILLVDYSLFLEKRF